MRLKDKVALVTAPPVASASNCAAVRGGRREGGDQFPSRGQSITAKEVVAEIKEKTAAQPLP